MLETASKTQDNFEEVQKVKSEFSVLNGRYEITGNLGDGHTSRVYLGRDISKDLSDPKSNVAIKIFKSSFL